MKRRQYGYRLIVSMWVLALTAQTAAAQMEEVIVYGQRTYDIDWWYFDLYEPDYHDTFERDLDLLDAYEEQREAWNELCFNLLINKPGHCTTDPGALSEFVRLFTLDSGVWLFSEAAPYREAFQPALVRAAEQYRFNQDSLAATQVFLDEAYDICVNGAGRYIDVATFFPVSNEVNCITVAAGLAEGMDPDFNVPDGLSLSFYMSFPVSFEPWGNDFYQGLDSHIKCALWHDVYNKNGCSHYQGG